MNLHKSLKTSLLANILLVAVAFSELAFSAIVDFETNPTIINASGSFSRAGPAQTIEVDSILTFTGGVVLGFPAFIPSTPLITVPNLYGTANHPSGRVVGHPTLNSTISIDIALSFGATSIEGVLLNGLNRPGSYTIEAFSNKTLVDSVSLIDLSSNPLDGFEIFRLDSKVLPITSVLFSPDLSDGEWDYFIDTVALNESLFIPDETVVPLPASVWLFASGVISLFSIRKIRHHSLI